MFYDLVWLPSRSKSPISHQAVCPPSTTKSAPVIKLLASASKYMIGPRYSSAKERRFIILSADHSASRFGCWSAPSVICVRMYPGLRVLTRINGYSGRLPHSAARERPSWRTAALEELYAAVSTPWKTQFSTIFVGWSEGKELTLLLTWPLILAIKTTLPPIFCLQNTRAAACAQLKVPHRLMSTIRRKLSIG